MIVELDAGNTSIKWRQVLADRQPGLSGSSSLAGFGQSGWADGPGSLAGKGQVAEVLLVSVLGEQDNRTLTGLLAAHCNTVRQFRSTAAQPTRNGLLRNGYRQPERLGADRWLAMVAALDRCPGPLLVVDSGSALTLDLVAGAGRHLGGYIVPGLDLAVRSLGQGTGLVRADLQAAIDHVPAQAPPAADTQAAVVNGLLRMHADLVTNCIHRHAAAHVLLTGGNGARLLPHMEEQPGCTLHLAPTLVLDGLGIVARA